MFSVHVKAPIHPKAGKPVLGSFGDLCGESHSM